MTKLSKLSLGTEVLPALTDNSDEGEKQGHMSDGDRLAQYYREVAESITGSRRDLMERIKSAGAEGVDALGITDPQERVDLNALLKDGVIRATSAKPGEFKIVFHEHAKPGDFVKPGIN